MSVAVRRPRFWLAAQMAAVMVVGGAMGLLRLQMAHDSPIYVAAAEAPSTDLLAGKRTVGYPLFLKAAGYLSPDYRLVPYLQVAALFAAVWAFDGSLRRFGATAWEALLASSALLWAAFQDAAARVLLVDFLAMVAAVATLAMLLRIAAAPRRAGPWVGLTAALAAAYHLRPAYLFLIPLVPILGLVLRWIYVRAHAGRPGWMPLGGGLAAAAVAPFAAFCLLRLVLVGEFGLVSFGGYSIVGIAAQMVDDESVIAELPESNRPLATAIFRERRERGLTPVFVGRGRIRLRTLELQYNDHVWRVAVPAAVELCGDDPRAVNEALSSYSKAVVRRYPGRYLLFVAYSFPRALLKYVYCSWLAQILLAAGLGLRLARRFRRRAPAAPAPGVRFGPRRDPAFWAVLCTGLMLLLAKVAFLVLVICICSRYILPAGVLVPPGLALWILREWQWLRDGPRIESTDNPAKAVHVSVAHARRSRRRHFSQPA